MSVFSKNSLVPNYKVNICALDQFNDQWNKIVDTFFNNDSVSSMKSKLKNNFQGYPKADVLRNEKEYKVVLSVPGVKIADLIVNSWQEEQDKFSILPYNLGGTIGYEKSSIHFGGESVSKHKVHFVKVSGKMADDYVEKDGEWQVRELKRGSFERVFQLPEDVSGEPQAVLKDGLLTLIWHVKPKEEVPKIKNIEIKSE